MKETYLIKYTEYPMQSIDGFVTVNMEYKSEKSTIIHEFPQNLTDEYVNNLINTLPVAIRYVHDIIKLS